MRGRNRGCIVTITSVGPSFVTFGGGGTRRGARATTLGSFLRSSGVSNRKAIELASPHSASACTTTASAIASPKRTLVRSVETKSPKDEARSHAKEHHGNEGY